MGLTHPERGGAPHADKSAGGGVPVAGERALTHRPATGKLKRQNGTSSRAEGRKRGGRGRDRELTFPMWTLPLRCLSKRI